MYFSKRKMDVQHTGSSINFKSCNRCLVTSEMAPIDLDANGNCNYCNNYLELIAKPLNDNEITALIENTKSKKFKYHCVIGISGGADSCYLAIKCVEWGLNPLLVHVDNGWNRNEAFENIEIICKKFNLDLETHVLAWEDFKEVQRAHLLASVPEIETPTDIAILHCLYKSAIKHNIKTIYLGCNNITEGFFINEWHYNPRDAIYTKSIIKQFARQPIKQTYLLPAYKELYYKYFLGVKTFYPFNYFNYKKSEVIDKLNEIGWKTYGSKHHESQFTKFVQSYILPVKFGIDYRVLFLSTSILTNQLTKDEALKELQALPYNEIEIQKSKEYFCKKLDLTETEFLQIMAQPKKSYLNYSNSKKSLSFIYKIYSKISRKNLKQIR